MIFKKWSVLAIMMVMLGTILAGCGGSASNEQVMRVVIGGEPETLDPAKMTGVPEGNYAQAMFEGLTELDAQALPVAAAAEKWEISPDGLKYIFHLRANKWSNGDEVTAKDFEYAWKRLLNPTTAAEYAYMLFPIKGAEAYNSGKGSSDAVGVKAVDDHTLEVNLERPTSYFLASLTHSSTYPVNQKVVEANNEWATDVSTLIGNGPFKVSEWVHGSKLVMVKNDQYWNKDKVKLAKLEWTLVEEMGTALSMFENNQLDFAYEPPMTEVERLKKENKLQFSKIVGTYYYEFNNKKAPFDNPKVRKAFSLAIDRATLVKNVLHDVHKPAYAWIPFGFTDPTNKKDFREEGGALFKENIEEAKKLLAEAGYPDGQGLPPITLLYNTNENHKAIAEAVQEMWKKNLGVNVELQNQEWKVYLGARKSGDFQVARAGWNGDYADPMTFGDDIVTASGNNYGKYSSPAYDKFIETAQNSNDQTVRMQALHDADKTVMDDMGVMPIYFYTDYYCLNPKAKGLIASPTSIYNFKYVTIQE
ncbi:oligopeptide transport system substrate-binding protein [Sporomusaceae bacterium BoRhaA]|uniref:peptide ABC transporter substrate-binding protein n=1 Tax=Pelorhabdus rhamnosifermentans TaxID=2772457 RepID=UPI001C0603AE|nr:peptide ABC transporter substrate-binding protein [Pelorhabdus rhamnosifermentans]MBU2699001.1 oligopeptide transport system substrate-binding protein [Pelorhabdus rhamnosifermentans]